MLYALFRLADQAKLRKFRACILTQDYGNKTVYFYKANLVLILVGYSVKNQIMSGRLSMKYPDA